MSWKRNGCKSTRARALAIACGLLLAGGSGALAENDPDARFRGAPTYDLAVTNVKWKAATEQYSYVTFDLSWSHSWRAAWVEKDSASGAPLKVESWDAAWVFVKFLPEKDSKESIERNHWRHATLASAAADHVMPAGATSTVKLSDDGSRGMGVFIYRGAVGHGANNFKRVKLRWLHGTDKVDPAGAALTVHPIAMVYVPEGPFKVGTTAESGLSPFADGPDIPLMRYDGEESSSNIPEGLRRVIESTTGKDGGPYIRWGKDPAPNGATDGAWRGGPTIPFLVDAEWNTPAAAGTRGRLVGPFAGRLWSTHTFVERSAGGTPLGPLNDDYPTGYDAFYCMKYEMTQGQYVDFLNSLPPDVAAQRAIASHETRSDAGMYSEEVKVARGPGIMPFTTTEKAGNTVISSADMPAGAPTTVSIDADLDSGEDGGMDDLMGMLNEKEKPKVLPPVYSARCPFRKMPGVAGADVRAFAVWAGLRPMTSLELTKAISGPHDPALPDPSAVWANTKGHLEVADSGLPTERIIKGKSNWGGCRATRVGSCATATSDRSTARATYWGILEFDGMWAGVVPLPFRVFRGTHGNGTMPAGTPGASFRRAFAEFKEKPADWPIWGEYIGRFSQQTCRLVASASNRIKKPVQKQATSKPAAQLANEPPRTDTPKVANVKWEAGTKDYSTVSFDLSWENSWRAKWEEPAEKSVTGKPLKVESWDAAWVFVKFRPAGARDDSHATLSTETKDHQVPAGAALDVGLTDEGGRGVGVFIYRSAVGVGANDFEGVKLRWLHGEKVDPGKVELKVHGIAMVYVPEGPFASRSPWGHALTTITTADATQPGGHLESGPETMPLSDEWPNGFPAFYCMKYSISQGQYAELLNSIPSGQYNGGRYGALAHNNARRYCDKFYNFNGYTITTNAAGMYKADVPDRMCNLLSLPDIQAFIAWAGLRPPTNLEYEKACRGPRAVARGADAWTPATCAPAAGLDKSVLAATSAVGPGPSYWGIRELSLSGCVQEWPALIQNEWKAGVGVKGMHGNGSPEAPEEWPWSFFGDGYYGGIWRGPGYGTVGQWVNAAELCGMPWELMDASRTGRYGARAVRTALAAGKKDSPLVIDALPNMAGSDIGIFYLSGRFRNEGKKPLQVEVAAPLPDACFPEGAASRAFTAKPKAVTPFKILTVLTSQTAAGALRRGRTLPVRIETPGGDVLAEQPVRVLMSGPKSAGPPVIRSFDGGEVALRILNATGRKQTVTIHLPPPPGVKLARTERRVELAPGAEGRASFSLPRQGFARAGVWRMPYRVTVAGGAPQSGETAAELRNESRWWIVRRTKEGPKLETADPDAAGGLDDLDLDLMIETDRPSGVPEDLFKRPKPPKGWRQAVSGEGVPLGELGPLPSAGSSALAATRVTAPADREAVLGVQHKVKSIGEGPTARPPRLLLRVWLNDKLVHEARPVDEATDRARGKDKQRGKSVRLRAGGNTLLVECRSEEGAPAAPGAISVVFHDARDGKPVSELVFDVVKR